MRAPRWSRSGWCRSGFTLIMPDSMHFEVTEAGRTLRLDFRPKTLRERAAMWRRRYGL
jgi:hypothetical protein